MLFIYLLVLIAAPSLSFAGLRHGEHEPQPHVTKHGMFPGGRTRNVGRHRPRAPATQPGAPLGRRQDPVHTSCASSGQITTKAPKTNIFAGLTDDEAAAVTSFLHDQKSLNLTAAANATR